jgi:hypothetical protein
MPIANHGNQYSISASDHVRIEGERAALGAPRASRRGSRRSRARHTSTTRRKAAEAPTARPSRRRRSARSAATSRRRRRRGTPKKRCSIVRFASTWPTLSEFRSGKRQQQHGRRWSARSRPSRRETAARRARRLNCQRAAGCARRVITITKPLIAKNRCTPRLPQRQRGRQRGGGGEDFLVAGRVVVRDDGQRGDRPQAVDLAAGGAPWAAAGPQVRTPASGAARRPAIRRGRAGRRAAAWGAGAPGAGWAGLGSSIRALRRGRFVQRAHVSALGCDVSSASGPGWPGGLDIVRRDGCRRGRSLGS